MTAISIDMSDKARERVLLDFLGNFDFLKVKKQNEDDTSALEEHEELKQTILKRKNPAFLKHLD